MSLGMPLQAPFENSTFKWKPRPLVIHLVIIVFDTRISLMKTQCTKGCLLIWCEYPDTGMSLWEKWKWSLWPTRDAYFEAITVSSWWKTPLPFRWCIIDIKHKKPCIMQQRVTSPHHQDMMKLFPVKKLPLKILSVCMCRYVTAMLAPQNMYISFSSCTRWLHAVDNHAELWQYIYHNVSEPKTYLWQNVNNMLRRWSHKLSCPLVDI